MTEVDRQPGVGIARVQQLASLTSLRAGAALLVFMNHVNQLHGWGPARVFRDGYTGVTFFFVLSGVVLVWAHSERVMARQFLWRRFARIYPSTVVAIALAWMFSPVGPAAAAFSFALLQPWTVSPALIAYPSGVTWSLGCELVFYLAFPLLLPLLRRMPRGRRTLLVAIWAGGTIALSLVAAWHPLIHGFEFWRFVRLNPLVRSGAFVLGMWLALELREGRRSPVSTRTAAALLMTAMLATLVSPIGFPGPDGVLAAFYALLIFSAASDDITGRSRVLNHRWLIYAGEVSFAFYLVHQTVLRVAHDHFGYSSSGLGTLVCLVVACVCALGLHHGVEKPAQRRLVARR